MMTNHELDVKVAKAVGQKWRGRSLRLDPDGYTYRDPDTNVDFIWSPSRRIEDAAGLQLPDGWIMVVTITKHAVSVDVGRGCIGDAVFSWQGQNEAWGRTEAFVAAMEATVP